MLYAQINEKVLLVYKIILLGIQYLILLDNFYSVLFSQTFFLSLISARVSNSVIPRFQMDMAEIIIQTSIYKHFKKN